MAHQHHLGPPKKYRDLPIRDHNFDNVQIRIVNAAWDALFTKDPSEISLREIVQEVGVSQAAAYNHFRDKRELFGWVANDGLATLIAQMSTLWSAETGDLTGILKGLCQVWLGFAEARPRHYTLMYSLDFMDPARFPALTERRSQLTRFFEVVASQELGFDPRPEQGQVLEVMIHGDAALIAAGGPVMPARTLAEAMLLYLDGLRRKKAR